MNKLLKTFTINNLLPEHFLFSNYYFQFTENGCEND